MNIINEIPIWHPFVYTSVSIMIMFLLYSEARGVKRDMKIRKAKIERMKKRSEEIRSELENC